MRYKIWWTRLWSVAAALGVGLGMLEWSGPIIAVAVLVIAGLLVAIAFVLANELINPLGAVAGRRQLVTRSLAVSAALVGGFAVLAVSPAVALFLGLLAAVTSPPVVARVRRPPGQPVPTPSPTPGEGTRVGGVVEVAGPVDPGAPDPSPSDAVATMSVQELCGLWRHTFWQLRDEITPDRRASLVTLRQQCLEELERRNPTAFAAWLDSGGRASSAPERFMCPPRTEGGPDGP